MLESPIPSPAETIQHVSFDRWAWIRCPCGIDGSWDTANAHTVQSGMTRVLDISPQGVFIGLERRPALGMLLTVELEQTPRVFSRALLARVRQVKRHSPSGWVTGCEFVEPLSDQDFRALCTKPC
jgi:hypothetical protein